VRIPGNLRSEICADRRLIVFDCFGTLVRTRAPIPDIDEIADVLARRAGAPPGPCRRLVEGLVQEIARSLLDPSVAQRSTDAVVESAMRANGLRLSKRVVDDVLWETLGNGRHRHEPAPGATETLRWLAKNGFVLRILSNCPLPGRLMDRLLTELGIRSWLEQSFYSADGGAKKPHLSAFRIAGRGDFDTRIMVGDDHAIDLAPAARLGWSTVRVRNDTPEPFSGLGLALANLERIENSGR
jgi:putative hydrolase of the HAD superfamily